MVKDRIAISAAAATLLIAQPSGAISLNSGWYVNGGGGANWQTNGDLKLNNTQQDLNAATGWMASASVGYAWRNRVRLELEFAYRDNGVDSLANVAAEGDTRLLTGMVNALYTLPTPGPVAPFFGVGVGAGHLELDSLRPLGTTSVDDSNTGLALQAIGGIEYAVTDKLGLNLSYRYLYLPSLDLTAANGAGVTAAYESHAVMVGLRWSFGAPAPVAQAAAPPPPPPAAAPPPAPPPRVEPPRNYVVFFGWDSAELTPEARSVVQAAAQSARESRATRIELTGHADRSGPDAYNLALSQRRAEAVKAELVRLGVAAGQIGATARGETQPLIPTADGVREPQNRRVQIVFPGGPTS